ncbi:MAG: 23S rRNA (adenine(2030)-N(6))-methyltransferase RlmJ [Treponema sp.]|jgi:23S rRNA (adenine2030-N6)-methyltransferase|nr:23S rRNA (adenine(2030)-N(6))-methyltransferase RlmJ [Treponema sp.]
MGYDYPMLSYRHAFHAGNPADVLKHIILVFCVEYLGQKETPYLCIDTHAGAGYYILTEGYAAQNREWKTGIERLAGSKELPPLAARYLSLLREIRRGEGEYPGSPALIRALLRSGDRLFCYELHPADFALLEQNIGGDRRVSLRREDGFSALKALLPPPSRRGCIFIDPPYEIKDDYRALRRALEEGLRRFPTGLYIAWYPLLSGVEYTSAVGTELRELYWGNRCQVELRTTLPQERGMYGSGLVIINPPWTLKAALEETLPVLAHILGGTTASWRLDWIYQ